FGIAMGDAVNERIDLIRTDDGATWTEVDSLAVPRGSSGEGGFAASGTCLVTRGDSSAWIGTGSPDASRVYRTRDRGDSWQVAEVPVVSGLEAAGIMSLAFVSEDRGFAAGGALSRPDDVYANFAATIDGGRTWELRGQPQLPNIYGMAARENRAGVMILAVGPKGMDVSFDAGISWQSVDKRHYWGVHFIEEFAALAVGPQGRIARVAFVP
ncbi:MAG: hypothetical protein R3178_09850, partial [Rhodothermales bacterium]|nr:hypothetical protein [Rhodothermales bacterium]